MRSHFSVALLGYGTIGRSVHRLLVEHAEHIERATGRSVSVELALVRDAGRERDSNGLRMVDDFAQVQAADVDLVCEVMGGLEPAREYVLASLEAGTPVVTANKQLVAHHGPALWTAAEAAGTQLRLEASVCGAIPIVKMLRESLLASRVDRLLGILNGTTNYMLSKMAESGALYADALAEAQRLGYAEPDPSDDVGGVDAAAKLAILARIAFHTHVELSSVPTTGIEGVTAEDVAFARTLGCSIKLIGRAERADEDVRLDISPMLLPLTHPLSAVGGALNAVMLEGSPFGELVVQGPGAGGPETASAVVGDIVGAMGSEASFLVRDPDARQRQVLDAGDRVEPHYVRLVVPDRAGVLAEVAAGFARSEVSIERVIQQRRGQGEATLVITTHPARAGNVSAALAAGGESFPHSVFPMLEESVA